MKFSAPGTWNDALDGHMGTRVEDFFKHFFTDFRTPKDSENALNYFRPLFRQNRPLCFNFSISIVFYSELQAQDRFSSRKTRSRKTNFKHRTNSSDGV